MPSSATVLVVEDDKHILDFVVAMLQRQGFRVLSAMDGLEGLKLATDYPDPIDLMICDNRMPRMTGAELIKKITPVRAGMKVIFLSAADAPVPPELRSVTPLAKPFSLQGFLTMVRGALSGI